MRADRQHAHVLPQQRWHLLQQRHSLTLARSCAMDSPDLVSLLSHFDQKIARVQHLVPWARACNLLVQEHDARLSGDQVPLVDRCQLPDMRLLSELMLDMEDSIYAIDDRLHLEKKRQQKQKVRIRNLITDLNEHLDHISSKFPLNFGKSPEKPKTQKYGIHAPVRKSTAPIAKSVPNVMVGKTANAGTRTGAKSAPVPAARKTKVAAVGNPAANHNDRADKAKPAEPSAKKVVVPPAVLSGPAVVGAKSSKPAIPVRMTKMFMTRFNHNVNNKN